MKKITVVEVNDIGDYPPVQNLIKVLLHNDLWVNFIGSHLSDLPDLISSHPNFRGFETPSISVTSTLERLKNRLKLNVAIRKLVRKCMEDSDWLWTTSMSSIRAVGREALKYKNVLQLMELAQYGYSFRRLVKFPIAEWARQSWKTVVPEINRAYIQKVWWDLKKTPYVLPNKPYDITPGMITPELDYAISKMKTERRKIVLYLGVFGQDRDLEGYAKAISTMSGYVFFLVGPAHSQETKTRVSRLIEDYPVEYLGAFTPPKHLALVKYAHIGLLPYKPIKTFTSELNALYCAPNKIFEYAGYGVPMVGSDVLGLRFPFERWNMGMCCEDDSVESIQKAIMEVDNRHEEMSKNCADFYNSVDLDKIIMNILKD